MACSATWTVVLVLSGVMLAGALPRDILQEIPNYAPPLSPEQLSPPPASSTLSSTKTSPSPMQQSAPSPLDTGEGKSALNRPIRAARSCTGQLWRAWAPETGQVLLFMVLMRRRGLATRPLHCTLCMLTVPLEFS